MPRSADKLAFALSSTASLTRQKYKRLFDHLYVSDAAAAGWPLDDIADWRREAGRLLESLGVCDFFYDDNRIAACPPALTRLPEAGLPTVHLTGARTPALLQKLRAAVKASAAQVELNVTAQPAFSLLPNRMVLRAASHAALLECASAAELPVYGVTGQALLTQASTLVGYLGRQRREPASDLPGWTRHDFDPVSVRWDEPAGADVRLSMYLHPQQRGRNFYLYSDGEMQRVDPSWGRYAVLAQAGKPVLGYAAVAAVLTVPAGARLPAILERGVTLLSGIAPQLVFHDGTFVHAFIRVGAAAAAIVAAKLSQHLTPTTCPASVRNL